MMRENRGLSRRSLAAAAAALTPASRATAAAPSLMQDVRTYVDFGLKRCGGPGETRAAAWIADRLKAMGYSAVTGAFPVRTAPGSSGALAFGDVACEVLPQWTCPEAAFGSVLAGPLHPLRSVPAGGVAVLEAPFPAAAYWRGPQAAAAAAARSAGACALLIAAADPTDGIFAFNQDQPAPLPLPVAVVAPSVLSRAAAAAGAAARLRLSGEAVDATGSIVAARKPGEGAAIVISTPLTGWFACGAERGPGIALLLSLARALARSPRPIHLLVTGGHELGHLGMKAALRGALPAPRDVALWLHLGAGVAADGLDAKYGVRSQRILTVADTLFAAAAKALAPTAFTRSAPSPDSPGEAGDVVQAGYTRIIGVAGGFPGFHTPGDDGRAVDPGRLALIDEGLKDLVRTLG